MLLTAIAERAEICLLYTSLVASTIGFCGFLTYGNPYVMSLIVDRISADPVAPEAVFDVFGPYIAALIGINLAGQTLSLIHIYASRARSRRPSRATTGCA